MNPIFTPTNPDWLPHPFSVLSSPATSRGKSFYYAQQLRGGGGGNIRQVSLKKKGRENGILDLYLSHRVYSGETDTKCIPEPAPFPATPREHPWEDESTPGDDSTPMDDETFVKRLAET